jgi:hypothetical protein
MKRKLCSLSIMVLFGLLAFSTHAVALSVDPTDAVLFGNETANPAILSIVEPYVAPATLQYKANVGSGEEGPLAGSYSTTFLNTPTDPSGATIAYTGGDIVGPNAWLLVKDGAQEPAWYLFDLTDLGWNGMETLELSGFWPQQGAISYVALYGNAERVPEPATMLLLGFGLLGLGGLKRRFKK